MNNVTPINELSASMQRHPAGKGQQVPEVVYSTTTGDEPRGSLSLTTEATTPLPPPTKAVRKTTTKKRQPRVVAKAKFVRDIKVDRRVMIAAHEAKKPGQRLVIVSETEVRLVNRGC